MVVGSGVSQLLNDPIHWHARAAEARALAATFQDDAEAQLRMLQVATAYEQIAEKAEERLARVLRKG